MTTTRRDALKFSISSAAAFGLTAIKPGLAIGRMPSPSKARKMLVIFGRGANDALNSVIPHGDPGYALSRHRQSISADIAFRRAGQGGPRNSIVIPGITFAEAHPAMADLITGPGPWANGDLALLHRVGNPWGNRSHFTEMQVIESADAPQGTGRPRRDGWMNRLGDEIYSSSTMQSVSLSSRLQAFFRANASATTPRVDTHIQRVYSNNWNGGSSANQNNHGALYSSIAYSLNKTSNDLIAEQLRQGLETTVTAPSVSDEDRLVRQTWGRFLDSEDTVGMLTGKTHDALRFPANNFERIAANLPIPMRPGQYAFMQRMEEATILLGDTDTQIVGVELGGWDTHQAQLPDHEALLQTLSRAMRSAYEIVDSDTMILFVTEFGRTNRVNASDGTDHGIGGLFMALGQGVNGGLYNCHNGGGLGSLWEDLPTRETHPDYDYNAIRPATDFRTVFYEILVRHFGLTDRPTIEGIVPPWVGPASEKAWLNFLS